MEVLEKTAFTQLEQVGIFVKFLRSQFIEKYELKAYLEKYKWPENTKGLRFEETYFKFEKHRNNIDSFLNQKDEQMLSKECEEILKWGGVGVATKNIKKIKELQSEKIFFSTLVSAKKAITSNSVEFDDMPFPVNSGFSKIYACLDNRFIIYDSRVAAAMSFFIKKCFKNLIPQELLLGIPDYQAKAERNPENSFPKIRRNPKKYFLSNIKAAWIIEELAGQTPNALGFNQEKLIFAYQTALFVLGKNLSDIK